jgi:hypothetical protein
VSARFAKSFLSGDEMDHSEVKHLKVDHTPAELDEASKLLLRAANLIEKRGLNNKDYTFVHLDGSICVKCAITLSAGFPEDAGTSISPVTNYAYTRLWDATKACPYDWIIGRSQDEVVAKLRAVALGL